MHNGWLCLCDYTQGCYKCAINTRIKMLLIVKTMPLTVLLFFHRLYQRMRVYNM